MGVGKAWIVTGLKKDVGISRFVQYKEWGYGSTNKSTNKQTMQPTHWNKADKKKVRITQWSFHTWHVNVEEQML